jgi:2-polyprenyl-6-methoxyphenol hydroxylase-like FAD-dependent oxidoreductase
LACNNADDSGTAARIGRGAIGVSQARLTKARVLAVVHTPVLIVGAGPIGMQLALDLAWRGQKSMLVEQSVEVPVHPRAAGISPRTMEFMGRWGIADDVRNAGFPDDFEFNIVYCTSIDGFKVGWQHYPSMRDRKPPTLSPEPRERCPQIWFDPILARALAKYPEVDVRRPRRFESFDDRGTHVVARLTDLAGGESQDVTCDYLVACDGVASDIRRSLDVELEVDRVLSYSVNVALDLPQFLTRHDKGQAERYRSAFSSAIVTKDRRSSSPTERRRRLMSRATMFRHHDRARVRPTPGCQKTSRSSISSAKRLSCCGFAATISMFGLSPRRRCRARFR